MSDPKGNDWRAALQKLIEPNSELALAPIDHLQNEPKYHWFYSHLDFWCILFAVLFIVWVCCE